MDCYSQTRALPSTLAETTYCPSELKAAVNTRPSCVIRAISFTVTPASQTRVGVDVDVDATSTLETGVEVDIGEVSVMHDKASKVIPVIRYFLMFVVLLGVIYKIWE